MPITVRDITFLTRQGCNFGEVADLLEVKADRLRTACSLLGIRSPYRASNRGEKRAHQTTGVDGASPTPPPGETST